MGLSKIYPFKKPTFAENSTTPYINYAPTKSKVDLDLIYVRYTDAHKYQVKWFWRSM